MTCRFTRVAADRTDGADVDDAFVDWSALVGPVDEYAWAPTNDGTVLTTRRWPSYLLGKMKNATRMTSKGQVVIPKPVRDRLRWRDGTRLEIEALPDGALRLTPLAIDPVDQLIGCLREGDPIGDLEAEHRAEIEGDERRPRR